MMHMSDDLRARTTTLAADSRATLGSAARRALRAMSESRVNYALSYLIDLACPLALCWLGSRVASDWTAALLAICLGGATFSFVEYAVHRWYFHARATFGAAMHRAHHRSPADPMALPCFSSAAVSFGLWWLLSPLLGPEVASFFLCGLLVGYCFYAALHHLHHSIRGTGVSFRWIRRAWVTHAVHHSYPDRNFGVTTSVWDHVFGTYRERGKPISLRPSASSSDRAVYPAPRRPPSSRAHPRHKSSS
jgi:4-hydroxysphinganine ceramide fatty acyl 2-hydroxylase